ncbi:aminotransferase class IV, partial [bacterium]|nr:aminotransferase class IV [bacterium]
HLVRLERSASYFGWRIDTGVIRERLTGFAAELPRQPHRVRLLVSRDGQARLEAHPLGPAATMWRVGLAAEPVNDGDFFLYHKTTNRGVYEAARAACPGVDDVLLWNTRGELTESCIANVAVERRGRLVTPPVACGLLPGTYRAQLLAEGRLTEEVIRMTEVQPGAKVWLLNSVRGMWPATVAASPSPI